MKKFLTLLLALLLTVSLAACGAQEAPAAPAAPEAAEEHEGQPNAAPSEEAGEQDRYMTDPVPEGKPKPVEPQEAELGQQEFTCTISIACNTILDNMENLTKGKEALVPEDGWILEPVEVPFTEGESVFDVLLRVTRENKIHMEYMDTPMYNSAYIEGINNLYEFDCGPLSGWMYKVNEWFPNYGCSRYQLQDGDVVDWVYTCNDLGKDVGCEFMSGS